jgi:hypothetical protein
MKKDKTQILSAFHESTWDEDHAAEFFVDVELAAVLVPVEEPAVVDEGGVVLDPAVVGEGEATATAVLVDVIVVPGALDAGALGAGDEGDGVAVEDGVDDPGLAAAITNWGLALPESPITR